MYYILSKLSIVVKEKVTHYIVLKSSKISSWCHSNVNANSDTLLIFNSYIKYCLVSRYNSEIQPVENSHTFKI